MARPKGKHAWMATVGEKGQIVIPKQAREIFGIAAGDTLLLLGPAPIGLLSGIPFFVIAVVLFIKWDAPVVKEVSR